MPTSDARSLSSPAKEALRKRAVQAYLTGGLTQAQLAAAFGVHRSALTKWLAAYRAKGETALDARPKGPVKGTRTLLTPKQASLIRQMIVDKCPEQLKLPFYLWSREAVQALILRKCDVAVSINTAGNYLRAWGFTVQKPVRRAYEQNATAVQRWLTEEYPALQKRAKAEKAVIYWGDEMGLRSDDQVGRSSACAGRPR
jgi:transposase